MTLKNFKVAKAALQIQIFKLYFDFSQRNFWVQFQFALVHYFTKVGAGEYYLEELEETICMAEERLRQRRRLKLDDSRGGLEAGASEEGAGDQGDPSTEELAQQILVDGGANNIQESVMK